MHELDGVADHRRQRRCDFVEVLRGDPVGVEREAVVDLGEDRILLSQHDIELLAEDLGVAAGPAREARCEPPCPRTRPDPALGGAELVLAQVALGDPVELDVIGHDEMGVAGNDEPAHVDATCPQPRTLSEQHRRLDHDAVADDGHDVVVEHAARDELQARTSRRSRRWCDRHCGRPGSRTTRCMSLARRSVSLPFPSSPHWVPTTTVAGTSRLRIFLREVAPLPGRLCSGSRHAQCSPGSGEDELALFDLDGDRVAFAVAALEEG